MFEKAKERLAKKKAAEAAAAAPGASSKSPAPVQAPNSIVLFHYPTSPIARRVVWYLKLRGLDYAECLQPPVKPRPDLESLGINYRRIPVLSVGRDIYVDSRLILSKLSELFPSSSHNRNYFSPTPATAEAEALIRLFTSWTQDGGVFGRAAGLIPLNSPVLKDPVFVKDRSQFSGRNWEAGGMTKMRPEHLVGIKNAFGIIEGLLRDGREWVLGTSGPSLGDIEAIWPFHWLLSMPGALDPSYIGPSTHPLTHALLARFDAYLKSATSSPSYSKPVKISGADAKSFILSSDYAEHAPSPTLSGTAISAAAGSVVPGASAAVDANDPSKLVEGDEVEVYPTDSGFGYKDKGRLVGLNEEEVTVDVKTKDGQDVRLHAPRWGFRVAKVQQSASKL